MARVADAAEARLIDKGDSQHEQQIFGPSGCTACVQTGYQGRTGIFELLTMDNKLRALIHDGAGEGRLRAQAEKLGMQGIREDGLRWVRAGVTSLEEVLRVARE